IEDSKGFPDQSIGEASNYCRNPDGRRKPWCYTNSMHRQYCDIPMCSVPLECLMTPEGRDYIGHINVTKSGRPCKNWIWHAYILRGQRRTGRVGESNSERPRSNVECHSLLHSKRAMDMTARRSPAELPKQQRTIVAIPAKVNQGVTLRLDGRTAIFRHATRTRCRWNACCR
ncbi:hypothetical protein LSAT2_019313, partial [Lamellibrachia satsuma]